MTISEKEKKICKKKFHKNTTTGKMDGTQTKINLENKSFSALNMYVLFCNNIFRTSLNSNKIKYIWFYFICRFGFNLTFY